MFCCNQILQSVVDFVNTRLYFSWTEPKIQQTKMLVTCQRFGDLFLFGLVWQYSSIQKNIVKKGSKSWILTCSCHITLSLPFYTDPDSKRELNFCNGYLSLLYFCVQVYNQAGIKMKKISLIMVNQAYEKTILLSSSRAFLLSTPKNTAD